MKFANYTCSTVGEFKCVLQIQMLLTEYTFQSMDLLHAKTFEFIWCDVDIRSLQIGHFTVMINDKNNAAGCASSKYYTVLPPSPP